MTLVMNQDGEIAWAWCERDFSYLPNREAILNFIKTATAYKRGVGKKYLTFGEMIKPCKVVSEKVRIYKTNAEWFKEYDKVLSTAWKASDGTRAQFLANYCSTCEKCEIELTDTNGADLIDQNGNVIETLEATTCELEIAPNSIIMILFK
jgi:hypothetical protein